MDRLELVDGDVGVDLRRLEVGVAEEFLDVADVGATLEHQRRGCMPKEMAGALLPDAGGHHVVPGELDAGGSQEYDTSRVTPTTSPRGTDGKSGVSPL